jgi:type II secretory pathway component HofQ
LLTRTNGDAGKSITQVRALFNKLGTPTKQTIKALGEVGLTAGDLRESMAEQGLVGTLGLLNDAFDGNQEKIGGFGSSGTNADVRSPSIVARLVANPVRISDRVGIRQPRV